MNEKEIKKITSLSQGKYREEHGLFLVEGPHLVRVLLRSEWPPGDIIISESESNSKNLRDILEKAEARKAAIQMVEERIFKKLSSTQTPQGILAVVPIAKIGLDQVLVKDRIMVADGIGDPGNMGTIIRTAAAFGFEGLITTLGSVDIYSPKVVRATQGAIFRTVFIEHMIPTECVRNLQGNHKIYSLMPHDGKSIDSVNISPKLALVIGAEISGVDPIFIKATDHLVRIPMSGRVESLNAAVAAGIAMFELSHRNS